MRFFFSVFKLRLGLQFFNISEILNSAIKDTDQIF